MAVAEKLVTQHLDLWATAIKRKSIAGRGSYSKVELYGIKKLRELILELAVRGMLVPQDPMDEPASELLERIAAERAKLVKEGKIKKEKPLAPVGDDEKYFDIPTTWEWCRLQEVSEYIQRGKGPAYADFGAVRVASQKCVQWSGFDISASRFVDDASLSGYKDERFLKSNDLLWNSTGTGTVGRANVLSDISEKTLVADSHVTVIRPLTVSPRYLCSYIWSPSVQTRIEPEHEKSLVSGSTQQVELNTSAVMALPVPIPPLNEQKSIVAKVDELMALCDQLEQQTDASLSAHQTLGATLLNALTSAADHTQFASSWQRIAEYFDTLFTTEESIDQLKQSILQLAVMGKLVPQDPNAEPASDLLKQIAAEKTKMAQEGRINRKKAPSGFSGENGPYALPKGWTWVRVANVFNTTSGGSFAADREQSQGEYMYVKVGDMNMVGNEIEINTSSRFVNPNDRELTNLIPSGSIIFPKRGGAIATNKKRLVVKPIFVDLNVMAITPVILKSKYAYVWLQTIDLAALNTGTSVPQINHQDIDPLFFPLPPFSEQSRIVAKVDELMALCDQLKARLADVQTTQLHLADALAEQALMET